MSNDSSSSMIDTAAAPTHETASDSVSEVREAFNAFYNEHILELEDASSKRAAMEVCFFAGASAGITIGWRMKQ